MSRAGSVRKDPENKPSVEWAGAILVNSNGKFLLNLRDASNTLFPSLWDLIGGKIEAAESAEDCMLREIFEETGEALRDVVHLDDYVVPLEGGRIGRLHLFWGKVEKPAPELLVGEGQAHRFFDAAELDELEVVPGTLAVLRAYTEGRFNTLKPGLPERQHDSLHGIAPAMPRSSTHQTASGPPVR
jgi:8-oxo-dGTP pyrophosphatase MutT (NUDIX family)